MRTATPPATAEQISKAEDVPEVPEDVSKVRENRRVETAARAARRAHSRVTEAIVQTALFIVGQNGIRLGRFLELLLGRLVPGVSIGVVLQRQLAIRALQLGVARGSRYVENFVVVALAHDFATLTIEGLSSRSPMA